MARICGAIILFFLMMPESFTRDLRADTSRTWSERHGFRTTLGVIQSSWGRLNYEIHAHPRDEMFRKRVEVILQYEALKLIEYFQYVPKLPLHFIISDEETLANGSASVFPRNLIVLNTYPPSGHDYLMSEDDFIRGLVLHELVHILHMDQTKGLLGGLQTIFGSVAKLGGIVPRWFSEGLATWAESNFTNGGRLKSKRLDYATKFYFAQKTSCRTIDCLDDPGTYPHGSLAYWIGARFIEWLEKNNPGSARCLVNANADSLPFFLNDAFKECHNDKAQVLFRKFIDEYAPIKSDIWGPKDWPINFQKGMAISQDVLVVTSSRRDQESLYLYHLVDGWSDFVRLPYAIHQIHQTPTGIMISVMPYQRFTDYREWLRFDVKTKSWQKLEKDKTSYDWWLDDYSLRRVGHQVLLWHENEIVKEFAALVQVRDLGLAPAPWWISYDANNEKPYHLETTQKKLWQQDRPFDVLAQCQEQLLLQDEQGLFVVENAGVFELNNPNRLVEIVQSENHQVVFYQDQMTPEIINGDCSVLFGQFQRGQKKYSDQTPIQNVDSNPLENYLRWHHFRPHYWFFNYQTGDNVSSWRLFTSLADPLERHVFSLATSWYPSLSQFAPDLSYTYNLNAYSLRLTHQKTYTQASVNQVYDQDVSTVLELGRDYTYSALEANLSFYHAWNESRDFISSRKTRDFGLRFVSMLLPLKADDWRQAWTLNGRFFRSRPYSYSSYWGGQLRFDGQVRLTSSTTLNSIYSLGRLNKDDFRSGVLYAGGSNDAYSSNFHEFYGLDRAQAFGNTIQTARMQINQELWPIYRSKNLMPIYFKTINLLAGVDWIKAERTLFERAFVREKNIFSYHVGTQIRTNLAYYVPLDIELIYSNLKNPIGQDQSQVLFLLKGSLGL